MTGNTAFSDGVIAIIITIMVLELRAPQGHELPDLAAATPTFLSYALSFIYVALYWLNHHHLLYAAERVNGAILWANIVLLFFLSLMPFSTAWLGDTHGARWPTIVYGASLLAPAIDETLSAQLHANDHELANLGAKVARGQEAWKDLAYKQQVLAVDLEDARHNVRNFLEANVLTRIWRAIRQRLV